MSFGQCSHAIRNRGHRWQHNLCPLLPDQKPGASATSALSSVLQAAVSSLHCHLGSYGHHEPAPTWHADTHARRGGVTVTCLVPDFLLQHFTERGHTSKHTRCTCVVKVYFLIILSLVKTKHHIGDKTW